MSDISLLDVPFVRFRALQGFDWECEFKYTGADKVTPIDLTGYVSKFILKQKGKDTADYAALVDYSSATSGITLTPLTGSSLVKIPKATTAAFKGDYTFTMYVTAPNGVDTPLAIGEINFGATPK